MININNELGDIHKKTVKKKIMDTLIAILKEKLWDTFKQNVQNELKKYQHHK
jgi:hypothetical protein